MDIAALILAAIALGVAVVTLPTVFQMWWGGPKLIVRPYAHWQDSIRRLRLEVSNEPVRGWLRKTGVSRAPAEICAVFKVTEAGTGRVVAVPRRAKLTSDKDVTPVLQVSLHAMVSPAMMLVAICRENGCTVLGYSEGDVLLPQGQYTVQMEVNAHDGNFWGWAQDLIVGADAEGTYWSGDARREEFKM